MLQQCIRVEEGLSFHTYFFLTVSGMLLNPSCMQGMSQDISGDCEDLWWL